MRLTWLFQSYRDYHADIFPDTIGLSSAMGPADWFEDKLDAVAPKISLDPKKRPREVLTVFQERLKINWDNSHIKHRVKIRQAPTIRKRC